MTREQILQMDIIYDTVNSLCHKEEYEQIDQLLLRHMEENDIALRIAWLTTSAWVRSKLKNRDKYVSETVRILEDRGYSEVYIQRLLYGLI